MTDRFALLIPVKTWIRAKSRLGLTDPGARHRLMRAFALDAIAAAQESPAIAEVYVVSDEPDLALPGVHVVPDKGDGDLNAAISAASTMIVPSAPPLGIAVMCADLPCLVASDLSAALTSVSPGRAFVADAARTGTTLLAATPGFELSPRFGPGSARLHQRSGAVPVGLEVPSLRLDVDTRDDLERAVSFGVGRQTAAVLAAGSLGP